MGTGLEEAESIDEGFGLDAVFPDADAVFKFKPSSAKDLVKIAWVALDTNVLLAPYRFGSQPFTSFVNILRRLKKENRLIIPAHVAREYARRRQRHLADLIKNLVDVSSRAAGVISTDSTAIDESEDYKELKKINSRILSDIASARKIVRKIDADLSETSNGDPILREYRGLFSGCVVGPSGSLEELKRESEDRIRSKRPPGYKDGSKSENSEGDFLIWKAILEIGAKEKVNLLFVTGDEKPDWFVRSNKKTFQPRYELIAEYAEVSGGKTIDVIPMHVLMQLFDAPAEDVEAAKIVENEKTTVSLKLNKAFIKKMRESHLSKQRDEILREIEKRLTSLELLPDDGNEGNVSLPWNRLRERLKSERHELIQRLSDVEGELLRIKRDIILEVEDNVDNGSDNG